jgi:hypothetical protein
LGGNVKGTIEQQLGGQPVESAVVSLAGVAGIDCPFGPHQQDPGGHVCARKGYVLLVLNPHCLAVFELAIGQWEQTVGELLFARPLASISSVAVGPAGLTQSLDIAFDGGARFTFHVPQSQQGRVRRLLGALRRADVPSEPAHAWDSSP